MKSASSDLLHNWPKRFALFVVGIALIAIVYLFQRTNLAELLGPQLGPNQVFVINRTTRLIFNDVGCFLIILAIFEEKKYLRAAFLLFMLELLLILPIYFIVKLTLEGDSELSSPFLSQIHRLIVNPVLMILLMAGFLYQRISHR